MAEVLAFPLARRRGFIRRQAAWYCEQGQRAAESNLQYQMMVQRDALLNKGVDPASVEAGVRALEQAIRDECLRLTFSPQVGA